MTHVRKTRAYIVREALEDRALLNLAKLAEKLPLSTKAPRDLSLNHDYYAWGGRKK